MKSVLTPGFECIGTAEIADGYRKKFTEIAFMVSFADQYTIKNLMSKILSIVLLLCSVCTAYGQVDFPLEKSAEKILENCHPGLL
jgi:hypothetical protein